ncbi:hypothetical protein ColTof3_09967 [Colletotrichum tofieldiae]|nr:hypothetical protein ColTof3_09967 [Colletotrichum tofieldiae]GKT96373.1 hypothetical protein Ct61P_14223 [Colletotrichum tofieldiae]
MVINGDLGSAKAKAKGEMAIGTLRFACRGRWRRLPWTRLPDASRLLCSILWCMASQQQTLGVIAMECSPSGGQMLHQPSVAVIVIVVVGGVVTAAQTRHAQSLAK